jgi:hypothetical protein
MLKVIDIQNRYGVTQGTVLGWIRSGELKAVNVGQSVGKKKPRWRIPQAALDAFEAARTATPAAPKVSQRRKTSGDVIAFYS